jgi:hypothetical protein
VSVADIFAHFTTRAPAGKIRIFSTRNNARAAGSIDLVNLHEVFALALDPSRMLPARG